MQEHKVHIITLSLAKIRERKKLFYYYIDSI